MVNTCKVLCCRNTSHDGDSSTNLWALLRYASPFELFTVRPGGIVRVEAKCRRRSTGEGSNLIETHEMIMIERALQHFYWTTLTSLNKMLYQMLSPLLVSGLTDNRPGVDTLIYYFIRSKIYCPFVILGFEHMMDWHQHVRSSVLQKHLSFKRDWDSHEMIVVERVPYFYWTALTSLLTNQIKKSKPFQEVVKNKMFSLSTVSLRKYRTRSSMANKLFYYSPFYSILRNFLYQDPPHP